MKNQEKKLNLSSKDMISHNVELINQLFPHCITEQDGKKVVDFEKLKQEFSDDIVDEIKEKYELTWPGKREAIREARISTTKTLLPDINKSIDFENTNNVYVEGDNLEVLKILQESYLNKIKCIYIDPPYNTGKDFIYSDNFSKVREEELFTSGQIDEKGNKFTPNLESNGRYHSDWLSMMYPRLKLARNLLKEDGVIFMSIDDNEYDNLKKICDEIFGEHNFVSQFIWKKKSGGGNDSNNVVNDTESILCYAKRKIQIKLNDDMEVKSTTNYNLEDENGKYSLERLDKQSLGYMESLDYAIIGPDKKEYRVLHDDNDNKVARWRWGKEKVKEEYDKLVFKEGKVYTKNYQKAGHKPRNLLIDERFGRTRTGKTDLAQVLEKKNLFTAPKPIRLMQYFQKLSLNRGEIILDFFSGSATNAQAIMDLNSKDDGNRKYIMVQIDEEIKENYNKAAYDFCLENNLEPIIPSIAQERIKRAGAKIKEETGADIDYGFRVYKLSDSILNSNKILPKDMTQTSLDLQASKYVKGTRKEDIVTSIILDLGLMLDSDIKLLDNDCYVIEENLLFICLSDSFDIATIDKIKEIEPDQVVLSEDSFEDDSTLTNVIQEIKNINSDIELKLI